MEIEHEISLLTVLGVGECCVSSCDSISVSCSSTVPHGFLRGSLDLNLSRTRMAWQFLMGRLWGWMR